MTLEDCKKNIGKKVIYTPYKNCKKELLEYGIVTSVNNAYVFVRYTGDNNSKATRPEDI